jgi:hypothetical protein
MRYLLGTHRASWSQSLDSRHRIGGHVVRSPFIGLEGEDEVGTFNAPAPGHCWRAFLPHLLCAEDGGFLSATSAYAAIAKRWSSSGSKARAQRWVPVGRPKTGLRLDLGAGTSTRRRDHRS